MVTITGTGMALSGISGSGSAGAGRVTFGGSTGNVTYDPGLPFGQYRVCAQYNFGTTASPKWRKSNTTPTVNLNNATGVGGGDLVINNTGASTTTPPC